MCDIVRLPLRHLIYASLVDSSKIVKRFFILHALSYFFFKFSSEKVIGRRRKKLEGTNAPAYSQQSIFFVT